MKNGKLLLQKKKRYKNIQQKLARKEAGFGFSSLYKALKHLI